MLVVVVVAVVLMLDKGVALNVKPSNDFNAATSLDPDIAEKKKKIWNIGIEFRFNLLPARFVAFAVKKCIN